MMIKTLQHLSLFFLLFGITSLAQSQSLTPLEKAMEQFESYTGVPLVFHRSQLPPGQYYDVLKELESARKLQASLLLVKESQKYPPLYLKTIGLRAIGVFAACVSKTGDGFREYEEALEGYRYYGLWNGKDALVAAFYSTQQLPLTFHHEIFHHVDATFQGNFSYAQYFQEDDLLYQKAIQGSASYPAPVFSPADLKALKKKSKNYLLEEAVSDYCKKNWGEDQAETARYFMSQLPDALVQIAENPSLPGSQRILHILKSYENALPQGPTIQWFLDTALERKTPPLSTLPVSPKVKAKTEEIEEVRENPYLAKVDQAISDSAKRKAIRRIQPATVRIAGGSGINIASHGLILTAGHVAKAKGQKMELSFPEGQEFQGECIAYSAHFDLALIQITSPLPARLPYAPLAKESPSTKTWVACIGQPGSYGEGSYHPDHTPFYVSVGHLLRFDEPLLGPQIGNGHYGKCLHNAWTYWGHSGSPLLNASGEIVAIHNSWNGQKGERHAVPHQAILAFLKEAQVRLPQNH
jgi:hypothetical protein